MDNQKALHSSNLLKKMIQYAPGSLLTALLGLLSATIFTRIFGASEYGRYSLALSIAMFVSVAAIAWLQTSLNRYLPSLQDQDAINELKQCVSGGLLLVLVAEVILALVLAYGVLLFASPEWQSLYLPTVVLIIASSLFGGLTVVLQAEMRAKDYTQYNILNALLKLSFSLAFVLLIVKNAEYMIYGTAVGTFILIPRLWKVTKLISAGSILRRRISTNFWKGIRQLASYGMPMVGWFLAAALLGSGDRYIIQWFRGSAEVGIYSANCALITGAVGLLNAPIILAAHPFLMKANSIGDIEQTGKWLGKIIDWFVAAGILLISFMWLFSSDFAYWFLGSDFREGHVIMPIVTAGYIVFQLSMYTHKPLEFREKTVSMLIISVAAVLVNFASNIYLVPKFGYIASAYVTLVSYLFYNVVVSYVGKKIVPWKMHWQLLSAVAVITLLGIIAIYYDRRIIQENWGYASGVILSAVQFVLLSGSVLYMFGFSKLFKTQAAD